MTSHDYQANGANCRAMRDVETVYAFSSSRDSKTALQSRHWQKTTGGTVSHSTGMAASRGLPQLGQVTRVFVCMG